LVGGSTVIERKLGDDNTAELDHHHRNGGNELCIIKIDRRKYADQQRSVF
jgi:hypothetical protein